MGLKFVNSINWGLNFPTMNFEEKKESESAIQETREDKSNFIYSKEVVSLIILGNTFYFYLYPLFLIPPFYPTLCPNESLIWS